MTKLYFETQLGLIFNIINTMFISLFSVIILIFYFNDVMPISYLSMLLFMFGALGISIMNVTTYISIKKEINETNF